MSEWDGNTKPAHFVQTDAPASLPALPARIQRMDDSWRAIFVRAALCTVVSAQHHHDGKPLPGFWKLTHRAGRITGYIRTVMTRYPAFFPKDEFDELFWAYCQTLAKYCEDHGAKWTKTA